MKSWVDITIPNRPTERHRLKASGATLGRHRRATLCVRDAVELLPEHLRIAPAEGGCQIELVDDQSAAPVYHGRPLREGLIPWNEEFFVGSVHVRVVRDTLSPKTERTNPLLVVFVLAAVGFVGWTEYQKQRNAALAEAVPQAPAFSVAQRPCKLANDAAAYRAQRAEEQAHARFTRSVFYTAEAPEALALLSEARACFDAAGMPADATRAENTLRQWEASVVESYKSHLLRLEMAMRRSDHEEIQRDLAQLSGLVPKASPYGTWLANYARTTDIEVARAKQNKKGTPAR